MYSRGNTAYDLYEQNDADLDSLKIDFFSSKSLEEKTRIQEKYNREIERQYQLLEELKIELDEMEADTNVGNFRDQKRINHLVSVSQISGLDYNQLKDLTKELRSIQRSIPTAARVTTGLEKEMYYDETEIRVR